VIPRRLLIHRSATSLLWDLLDVPYVIIMTITILFLPSSFVAMIASRSRFLRIPDLAIARVWFSTTRYGILHCSLSLQLISAVYLYCPLESSVALLCIVDSCW